MADIEVEAGFVSLMDLANTNTDAVKTILTRLPYAGIYTVKGLTVEGKQSEPNEKGPGLISYNYTYETLAAKLVDKDKDPQALVGRKLSESFTLWPDQFEELLGLLKGRYQKVGLDNTGNPGGVQGAAPGWTDRIVDHIFEMRVYTFKTKAGVEKAGFDWIGVPGTAAA